MNECKTWGMLSYNVVANNSRLLFLAYVFHQIGMSVQHCTVLDYIPNVFHSVHLSYFIYFQECIEMYKIADNNASKLSMVAAWSVHTGSFGDAAGDRWQLWIFNKKARNAS